jgi:hypothetical protein
VFSRLRGGLHDRVVADGRSCGYEFIVTVACGKDKFCLRDDV